MDKYADEYQISIRDFIHLIWSKKILIIGISLTSLFIAILISLLIPNQYTSTAILAPKNQEDSLTSKLSNYSAIANFSGITIPNDKSNLSTEALERIKSFEFFSKHFVPYINFEDLVASKKWNIKGNNIIYDSKIYDSKNKQWTRVEKFPKKSKPSNQEAYELYKDILQIKEDKETLFVEVSITHVSPYISKEWTELIIYKINEIMRLNDIEESKNSIEFLNNSLLNTNVQSIIDAVSKLLESQMQVLMLASSNKDYVFKTIDSPIAPEKRSSPSRFLIAFLGLFFGIFISVSNILYLHLYKEDN